MPTPNVTQMPTPNVTQMPTPNVTPEKNKVLETNLPEDIKVIGRYGVIIDPAANFTVKPTNLDNPLEVKRDTPVGALDAVARTGGLTYTTSYYSSSKQLHINSINELKADLEEDLVWLTFVQTNDSYVRVSLNSLNHTLSDGETFWLIYCDLSEYNPEDPRDFPTDRAVSGLSITVRFGKESATPTVNVTPALPTPEPIPTRITPEPMPSPTPTGPTPVLPTPSMVTPIPLVPTLGLR